MGQETAPAGFGFGVTGGVVSLSPEIDTREYGPGLDGFVRYTFSNGVQVLGGASWATVNVENVDDKRDLVALFVDGRFLLNNVSSLAPYIGVRASYTQHKLKTVINTIPTEVKGDGWIFSGVVGLLARLGERMAFEADLMFGIAPFNDVEINGETLPESGCPSRKRSKGGLLARMETARAERRSTSSVRRSPTT
jgi:hypothetical protein